jgi:hypothetical protein
VICHLSAAIFFGFAFKIEVRTQPPVFNRMHPIKKYRGNTARQVSDGFFVNVWIGKNYSKKIEGSPVESGPNVYPTSTTSGQGSGQLGQRNRRSALDSRIGWAFARSYYRKMSQVSSLHNEFSMPSSEKR